MTSHDLATLFLAVSILLAAARLLGEISVRFRQPAVLGELLAGIFLGSTGLGRLAPDLHLFLFPSKGPFPIALQALTSLSIAMYLLVAGFEIDLATVWKKGRASLAVSTMGMIVPFSLGYAVAYSAPDWLGGDEKSAHFLFPLFFGTALSITALPVISKILLELGIFRSDLGVIVVSAAVFNDLLGWMIFALFLGLIGVETHAMKFNDTLILLSLFVIFMLSLGRWLLNRFLPWLQAHSTWPGGILGFALSGALLCAAFTEWIGVHAVFGAFLFGVSIGNSRHLKEHTRTTIAQFVSYVFAPIFFASVALRVDFVAHFNLQLVIVVLLIATVGKVLGCALAARLTGAGARQAWAVGVAMNARGAMEIILGLVALQAGAISEQMFVALVVMALVTTAAAGTLIQVILKQKKQKMFTDFMNAKTFCVPMISKDRFEAIKELTHLALKSA
jgi:Kef-type K+ transport system membrane component KefB